LITRWRQNIARKSDKDLDILWASKGGNVDLSKWSKDDISTGLIRDYMYIDCKYFAASPWRPTILAGVSQSFTDTFWRLQKKFGRQLAPAEKKLISDPGYALYFQLSS